MQFVKRRAISIALASILFTGNAHAFITADFANLPVKMQDNIQKYAVYGEWIYLKTTQINNYLTNTIGRISVSMSVKSSKLTKTLAANEDMANLKALEMFEPKADICEVMVGIKSDNDESGFIVDIHQKTIKQAERSLLGFGVNDGEVTFGDGKNTDRKSVNQQVIQEEREKAAVDKIAEISPSLFEDKDTSEERDENYIANAGTPKPFNSDMIMNPYMYTTYNAEEQEIVEIMVNDILVPPVKTSEAIHADSSDNQIIGELTKQARYSLVHGQLTENYSMRAQVNGGDSLFEKMDTLSKYYYRGDGDKESLIIKMDANTEIWTNTLLQREEAMMKALEIYMSVEEYKENLQKEVLLANQILLKLDK